jgi:AmiR/NasT family two-component response regulator
LSEAKRELRTRKLIERAKGILQHRFDMSDEEAYLKLKDQSRQSHMPMLDLAEAVILSEDMERHQLASEKLAAPPTAPLKEFPAVWDE